MQGLGSGDYGVGACKSSGHTELELKNCISGTCFKLAVLVEVAVLAETAQHNLRPLLQPAMRLPS